MKLVAFKTSQASDVGSIPIARSINSDDSVALTLLNLPNKTIKTKGFGPRMVPAEANWSERSSG